MRMVLGERAFQAAQLFYLDNWCVINCLDEGLESFRDQWTKVTDLRRIIEEQAQTISALELCLAWLERRERRRRSSGSSLGPSNRSQSSLGSPVWGNVWTGVGTSGNPYEVQEVEIWSLEPIDDEVVPIPIPPPPCCGGFGHYEGTDAALWDPEEILQVNPDENSLPVPLRRLLALMVDDEGWIVHRDEVPPYEAPLEYS